MATLEPSMICSACLSEGLEQDTMYYKADAQQVFAECTQIELSNKDRLTWRICSTCMDRIENWLQFKLMCQENYHKWLELKTRSEDDGEEVMIAEIVGSDPDSNEIDHDPTAVDDDDPNEKVINQIRCPVCKESVQETDLGEHIKNHYAISQEKRCLLCPKSFKSHAHLIRHTKLHCRSAKAAARKSPSREKKSKDHLCEFCEKKFSSAWRLRAHKVIHSDQRPHSCWECGKTFKFAENLRTHEWKHQAVKRFECDVCLKKFFLPSELRNHAKRHDPAKKTFSCSHCDESFYNSSNLRDHQGKHTDEMPFVCEFCAKRFRRAGLLKDHTLIHTGEKPHQCPMCQKYFRKLGTLKTHAKTHRENSF